MSERQPVRELIRVATSRTVVASLAFILFSGTTSLVFAQGLGGDPGSFLDKLFGGASKSPKPEPSPAKTPPRGGAPQPAQGAVIQPALAPPPLPQSPPIVQQFLLSGVVIAEGTEMALLQELSGPPQPPRFVHVGQTVGGYRLTSVESDRVTLAGPGGQVVVLLGVGGTATGAVDSRTSPPLQPASPFAPRTPVSVAPAAPPQASPSPAPPPPPATPPVVEGSPSQGRALDRREMQRLRKEVQQAQRDKQRALRGPRTDRPPGSQAPGASE